MCVVEIAVSSPRDDTVRRIDVVDVLHLYGSIALAIREAQVLGVIKSFIEWRILVVGVYTGVAYVEVCQYEVCLVDMWQVGALVDFDGSAVASEDDGIAVCTCARSCAEIDAL